MKMIARFNTLSSWVGFEIIKQKVLKDRQRVLKRFVKVALPDLSLSLSLSLSHSLDFVFT